MDPLLSLLATILVSKWHQAPKPIFLPFYSICLNKIIIATQEDWTLAYSHLMSTFSALIPLGHWTVIYQSILLIIRGENLRNITTTQWLLFFLFIKYIQVTHGEPHHKKGLFVVQWQLKCCFQCKSVCSRLNLYIFDAITEQRGCLGFLQVGPVAGWLSTIIHWIEHWLPGITIEIFSFI